MKTMKKIVVSILIAVLVLSMIPMSAVAADTTENWIPISSAEDFMKIGKDNAYPVTGNYYLTGDIDFSDSEGNPLSAAWLVEYFSGVFDGRGYTLKGFKINATNKGGVFKQLSAAGTAIIRNLNIGSADKAIEATVSGSSESNFGFVACENGKAANRVIIENVDVYGNVNVTSTGVLRIGGMIGYCRDITVLDSSFNGSLTVTSAANVEKNVGGIVAILSGEGSVNRNAVIKNCEVNGTISQTTASSGSLRVGGIIGYSGFSTLVDNCTVNADLSGTDCVGGVAGVYGNDNLFAVTDVTVTGTQSGKYKGVIYGRQDANALVERTYIRGCSAQNTETRDFGDFGNGFVATKEYVWLIDEEADFAKIGTTVTYTDEAGAEQSYKYAQNGMYCLENDIVMKDAAYTDCVVKVRFGGVFDGNGHAIKNFTLNDNTNDAGFFFGIAHKDEPGYQDTLITDVSFGTADSYIKMSTNRPTGGVISGYAGHTGNKNDGSKGNHSVIINGVDVYANVTNTCTDKTNFGGFVGLNRRVNYYDCNMHGSITSTAAMKAQTNGDNYINMGAFAATVEVDKNVFYNCNNYADITVNNTDSNNNTNDKSRAGGFVAYTAYNTNFIGCSNYGTVAAISADSVAHTQAGGLVANHEGTSVANILDCANFGAVTAKEYAGAVAGLSRKPTAVVGFGQFGTVSGSTTNVLANADTAVTTFKLYTLDCVAEKAVTMVQGASIRLSSETGIRFKGNISANAYDRLVDIYGEDAVSYGVLIAPMAFVNAAGGTLTHEALDEYAEKNNFGADEQAYIDVVAEDWFDGEKGVVAGSIVKLPASLYNAGFTGVAYVTITADGYTHTIYADNAQTRSIKYVANAALNDFLYKKADGSLWELVDGQYVAYDKADADTYVHVVAEGDEYDTVSCYSEAQRATLQSIVTPAN